MSRFKSFHYHSTQRPSVLAEAALPPEPFGLGIDAIEPAAEPAAAPVERTFHNDEAAARHFMDEMWAPEAEGPIFEITAPANPAMVPDLRFRKVQESPATGTRLLHFSQSAHNVPVLGAQAVVEMTTDRALMAIDAQIADAPDVSPIATVSAADALQAVARKAEVEVAALGNLSAPRLAYWRDDNGWHLVYELRDVPVAPPEFLGSLAEETGHGLGASPRQDTIDMTYLVDAHDGTVLLYYSETPWLDLPVKCVGADELHTQQEFFGIHNGAAFELSDPIRKIRTFDLGFENLIGAQLPNTPVTSAQFDFAKNNTAAVSAHVNATRVFDFFNDVLKRDGVDDKGMELVSIVNTTYKPPGVRDWKNAVWYQNRMWYGQVQNAGNNTFESYSRYLDVIAHELSHGVTETTAGLKYLNESGALNESFSDIFGIIVKNLNGPHAQDQSQWDWELGTGLRPNNEPLRDLSDPTRTGMPAHMNDYKHLPAWNDSGGVHTNSNIHNKAAFNVLTSKKDNGTFLFSPEEAALMYYLTLTRLTAFATFADVLSTMQNVIRTLYAGRPDEIATRVAAVVAAYGAVGIT